MVRINYQCHPSYSPSAKLMSYYIFSKENNSRAKDVCSWPRTKKCGLTDRNLTWRPPTSWAGAPALQPLALPEKTESGDVSEDGRRLSRSSLNKSRQNWSHSICSVLWKLTKCFQQRRRHLVKKNSPLVAFLFTLVFSPAPVLCSSHSKYQQAFPAPEGAERGWGSRRTSFPKGSRHPTWRVAPC